MSANSAAITRIRDAAPSDVEALAQMFESSTIIDNGTVAGRLEAILAATEHAVVPGLHTGISFHDRGFRAEFRDPWPSSDNQVGHFLTAVGLSYNPAKVEQSLLGRRLRDWLGAPDTMSSTEVALRLTIGHEKAPDPSLWTAAGGAAVGGLIGGAIPVPGTAPIGAGAGGALAILGAFRDQFAAATAADVRVFTLAEMSLGTSTPLDLATADARLRGITVVSTQRGNSYQDLLLSLYGWRLGQWIRAGRFTSRADVAAWIRANLAGP
jgi:hypothetical protein